MQKRIVMCFDGSWNNTYVEQKREDDLVIVKPSNVLKLARGVETSDEKVVQIVHYGIGVGGRPYYTNMSNKVNNVVDKFLGGVYGAGFEATIEGGLTFLVNNYEKGDSVYVFGFSRGAAIANAITYFIEWLGGLPTKTDAYYLPHFLRSYIDHEGTQTSEEALNKINESKNKKKDKNKRLKFEDFNLIKIKVLGLWDSVLSLGGKLIPVNERTFFFKEEVATCVEHAYQALAVDEKRSDFTPSIWKKCNSEQTMEQRWFPGVHANIGGGYKNDGLANIALHWMIDKAKKHDLQFDAVFLGFYKEDLSAQLNDSRSFFNKFADTVRRKKGTRDIENSEQYKLHHSVILRICKFWDKSEPYTPENVRKYLSNVEGDIEEYLNKLFLLDYTRKATEEEIKKMKEFINSKNNPVVQSKLKKAWNLIKF